MRTNPTVTRPANRWNLLLYLALVLVCLPFVLPIVWMFISSLKSAQGIFGSPFGLNFDAGLSNFARVFHDFPFARQYLNSLLTAAIAVPVTLLLSATAGYAFARMRFPGCDLAFVMTLAAMMVPAELVAIPQFIVFKNLHLANTLVPIILLQIFSATGALSVFLMRQHFITLPRELDEAGRIDGLGTLGVFRHIMLPLSRPALATVAIFAVLNSWNDYFNPLIYLNDEKKMTLPLALQRFTDPLGGTYWNLTLAASVLVALPVLLAFLMAQRTFIESLASSGTKG